MKYKVFGDKLPAVSIQLDANESIYTQSGGMTWMTDNFNMETNVRGGLMKGLGRMLSGESLFMATYTSLANGAEMTLASSFPGAIIALELDGTKEYIAQKYANIVCKKIEIDTMINEIAEGWKTERLGKVDLTILRLAVYEIKFDEEIPDSVAINEAVELAKMYGADNAPSFINGVLAKIIK